jgi:hypothetical protein
MKLQTTQTQNLTGEKESALFHLLPKFRKSYEESNRQLPPDRPEQDNAKRIED